MIQLFNKTNPVQTKLSTAIEAGWTDKMPEYSSMIWNEDSQDWEIDKSAQPSEAELLVIARQAKLTEIKQLTDTTIASATPDCSESEIKSWDQQLQEATKVLADENYQSVMLTLMCQHRGQNETVEQLANKIIALAEQFKPFSAIVIAQSQALIKQLEACTTLDEINAINVEIKVN